MKRLLVALTTVAALMPVAGAEAARNPYGPIQVCGNPNFRVIDRQAVATPSKRLGTTYLLYNPNTGFNCVVTIKSYGVGKPTPVSAAIRRQGGPQRTDSGNFRYYAGPRKVRAPGRCVQWGGGITVGRHSAGFLTAFEHCA